MRSSRLGRSHSWTVLVFAVLAACSPEPRWIAVAGLDEPAVLVFDGVLANTDTLPFAPSADLHFGPDGTTLYLALHSENGARIAHVARTTGLVLQEQPISGDTVSSLWLLQDGRRLVATGTTTLYLFPLTLSSSGSAIEVCEDSIRGFFPRGIQGRAYAVCAGNSLVEIDTGLEIVVRSTSHDPCGMEDVALSPNGTIVYVLCQGTGALLYIDRLTLAPFDSVLLGRGGSEMAVAPSGRKAAIARPDAGEVVIVDLRRRAVESRVQVDSVWDVAIGADGRFAYVTTREQQGPGRLVRIDLADATVSMEKSTLTGSLNITLWPGPETPKLSFPTLQTTEP